MRHRVLALAVALLTTCPGLAQHGLGAREQWQPQIHDTDARLRQTVEIEILGRAAAPALELLSEATGVSLSVAPENLTTVGERKLTIISKGLSLRAIMAQIPEALQEAHWDIDTCGEKTAYVLHRNAGMDNAAQREEEARNEAERPLREEALAEVRRALMMSGQELDELEESDLFLARACRSQYQRAQIEAVLALPPAAMEELLSRGRATVPYEQAPPVVQAAARLSVERNPDCGGGTSSPQMDAYHGARQHPEVWRLSYWFVHGTPRQRNRTLLLDVLVPCGRRYLAALVQDNVIPPYEVMPRLVDGRLQRLLEETGTPSEKARQLLEQRSRKVEEALRDYCSLAKRLPRREPDNPELLVRLTLDGGDNDFIQFLQIEQMIAHKTNFSVISDYFTDHGRPLADELRQEFTLWQLLHLLGDGRQYEWSSAGRCLVFHTRHWPRAVAQEIPEAVIDSVRQQLSSQGQLTLRDLVDISGRLTDEQRRSSNWPRDCRIVNLGEADWALSLCSTITPVHERQARSASGFPISDMTAAQQRQVRARAQGFAPPIPANEIAGVVFRIVENMDERDQGWRVHFWRLWLQFGRWSDEAGVMMFVAPSQDLGSPVGR